MLKHKLQEDGFSQKKSFQRGFSERILHLYKDNFYSATILKLLFKFSPETFRI